MLTLSLAAVSRGEERVEGEVSPEDPLWHGADVALLEPLRVELRATYVGEGVLVRGRMRTRLALECRRCLADRPWEVDEHVDLLFQEMESEEEEQELSGEVYPLPERGDQLDLRPALREQLLLLIPSHVVCDESCRGLCPQCGADLNQTTCTCVPETRGNPWDALKQIRFD